MNISPSPNPTKLLIRVYAWQRNTAHDAADKLRKRVGGEKVTREFQIKVDASRYFDQEPSKCGALANWDDFQARYDSRKTGFLTPTAASENEVLIFLLDGVPPEFIPLICLLWSERMKKCFGSESESLKFRVPCHLAVLSRESAAQFDQCCSDTTALFNRLEALRTFSLEAPILLTGPSGTGKTFFAGFLHRITRGETPFKRVNLASLSPEPDKFESIMVGHTKGAFTGADQETEGHLLECQNGTLFLDELDGLSLPNQILLLTYTDNLRRDGKMTVRKYGSAAKDKLISRPNMIFATNRNVQTALREGRLRPDFLYRFRDTVAFAPLQKTFQRMQHEAALERDARVAIHLWFFLMKLRPSVAECPERFWRLCPSAIWSPEESVFRNITEFHWSGNLRTLEKYCRHLLDLDALDRAFEWERDWIEWESAQYQEPSDTVALDEEAAPHFPHRLEQCRADIWNGYRDLIKMALDSTQDTAGKWRTTLAAKLLGIDTRTLEKKMKSFELKQGGGNPRSSLQ